MSAFPLKKLAIALGLTTAMTVHAAGLGNMMSSSKLGEPLKAEIELLAVSPGELSGIQASLASEQFYQDQQLEKPASYPFIKVEVGNNSKGQPVLKLSSSQPITEAFLDMLIQVDWPTGRLVKEYTLLLDPPGFESNYVSEPVTLPASPEVAATAAAPAPAKVIPAPASSDTFSSEQPDAHEHPDALQPEPGKRKAASARPQKAKPEAVQAGAGVEVQGGDTLNQIARQFKPEDASVEQMLTALYQSNPGAFDGKNMNRLKVGKILKLPDHSILASITQQQAQQLVSAQTADWETYKNALAKAVEHAPVAEQGRSKQQAAGKIGANNAAPPVSEAGKDVLKLSAGDEKSSVQTDKSAAKGMQDKLNALQEDLTAKDNALKEEQSRTVDLEKQVADMKKLLAMKNDAMAKLQQESATGQAAPTAEQPQAAVTPAPAPAVADTPPPAPEAAAPPADAGSAQPTLLQALLDRYRHAPLAMLIALFALPLLAILWVWMRVRRKKQIHSFEDAIVTSPATEMQGNTVFGQTQAASGDTSFLTDFSQSAVGGMIDANDVDPIAEAEVYMAYGRDAQAEEILKDAIEKDPQRQELKLKLLEIYQAAANVPAFNQVAQTLYAVSGAATPGWPKVVAMGSRLDPANPLYQTDHAVLADTVAAEAPPVPAVAEDDALMAEADADMASAEVSATGSESVNPALKPKPLDLPALDFETASEPAQDNVASPFSGEPALSPADNAFDAIPELSFELGGTAADPVTDRQPAPEMSTTPAADNLEDDLSLAEGHFPEIALDIPTDLPDDLAIETGTEEVDTKLDLIKAYIDMEDIIGAKELIDEVLKEGSEAQRSRAQALLAQLPQ